MMNGNMNKRQSHNYSAMPLTRAWKWPWEKRHKTVHVICANCLKTSAVTLYGLPNEYRGMIMLQKCMHCYVTGQLTTSDLPKSRPVKDRSQQLTLFRR